MAFFRSVATVGLLTLLSRILGFLRDLMTATMLGAGQVADAFVVAQRLPTACRAIFAEGAMDSAFVPIYARKKRAEKREDVNAFVNHIFTLLVLILLPLTALALIFMPLIIDIVAPGFSDDPHRYQLAIRYSRIVFGFLFLISVTALQGGLLNANNRFIPLAAAPAIMNVVMIGGYVIAIAFRLEPGLCGSWSMLIGGVVQTVLLQIACRRAGLELRFSWPRWTQDVKRFFKLVGPGVIGVGAEQVNVLVSTMLASTLPSGVISALYYADRLNQLPIGVVGGAIGTALLPVLTHHLAAKESDAAAGHFSRAIEIGLLFCLPACIVLAITPYPITHILFQHGAFDANNARVTAETIFGYGLSIPGAIMARIFTIRFYAHEDTRTPVIVAFLTIAVNAVLAYALRERWQHLGIALAFSATMALNAVLLWLLLARKGQAKLDGDARRRLPFFILANLAMGLVLWLSATPASAFGALICKPSLIADIVTLGTRFMLAGAIYFLVLYMIGAMRLEYLRALMKH